MRPLTWACKGGSVSIRKPYQHTSLLLRSISLCSFLLAFVQASVVPSVVPGHHQVFKCFISNCEPVNILGPLISTIGTYRQPRWALAYLRRSSLWLELHSASPVATMHPCLLSSPGIESDQVKSQIKVLEYHIVHGSVGRLADRFIL